MAIFFACLTKASFRRLTLKCAPVFECGALERVQLPSRFYHTKKNTAFLRCSCGGTDGVCLWQYFSLALRKRAFDGLRSNVHPYSSAEHSSEFNSQVDSTSQKRTPHFCGVRVVEPTRNCSLSRKRAYG